MCRCVCVSVCVWVCVCVCVCVPYLPIVHLSEATWEDMLYGRTVSEMLEIIKENLLITSERYIAPKSLR